MRTTFNRTLAFGLAVIAAVLALALAYTAAPAHADLYMHNPKGSNNRVSEQARERNNANRMFNSQNNARGGYNKQAAGQAYYYAGSQLTMEWTSQHSCADPTNNCMFVVQYMCDANVRDGTTTQAMPTDNSQCANGACDTDTQYGRHESFASFATCQTTYRNTGLFTADQDLTNAGQRATSTRTNPNNERFGMECPEERDYYPYWNPSQWRDAAIITSATDRCTELQAESQNVKPRYSCTLPNPTAAQAAAIANRQATLPVTQAACTTIGGTWTMTPAFNIPAPECIRAATARDNHLGDVAGSRYTYSYNWTVPASVVAAGTAQNCVMRMRYNISTSDFTTSSTLPTIASAAAPAGSADGGYASSSSVQAGITSAYNAPNGVTGVPIWTKYNMQRAQQTATGNSQYARGYVYKGDPNVDPFGPLLWASATTAPTAESRINLRLAVNTQQFFRIFQDRSHRFRVSPRPAELAATTNIYNLNVRGKSGNIVQVYPSVEYDFVPERLQIKPGDYVHIQWWGSNTNPDAPNTDRSNILLQANSVATWSEATVAQNPAKAYTFGQLGRVYPARLDASTTFLNFTRNDLQRLAHDGLNNAYFDLGPRQVRATGVYNFFSSRNNAFSNRNQQATIVVKANDADGGAGSTPVTPLPSSSVPAAAATPRSSSVAAANNGGGASTTTTPRSSSVAPANNGGGGSTPTTAKSSSVAPANNNGGSTTATNGGNNNNGASAAAAAAGDDTTQSSDASRTMLSSVYVSVLAVMLSALAFLVLM